jgi:uncharacterized paraquat-inducible protein A
MPDQTKSRKSTPKRISMKVTVSDKTQKKRLKICQNCEFRKLKFLSIFNADSCGKCKCNLKAKTKMSASWGGKCPIDKW